MGHFFFFFLLIGKKDMKKKSRVPDSKFSKREFREFVFKVISLMAGGDENFDNCIEFLTHSVEVNDKHSVNLFSK